MAFGVGRHLGCVTDAQDRRGRQGAPKALEHVCGERSASLLGLVVHRRGAGLAGDVGDELGTELVPDM